ncbi:MAG: NAD+ synthase [bacterium]|nr:MAG: NAD+ synthase [bacterium]
MKISLHQINSTIGDFSGNVDKILDGARRARDSGAELAVFPELCLVGYPPLDLLENREFIGMARKALEALIAATAEIDLDVLIGTVLPREDTSEGKPLYNAAVLIRGGRVVTTHRKILLPTYDVFDENRHFEPGAGLTTVEISGGMVALSICEDVWNDKTYWKRRIYHFDPVEETLGADPMPLINIAASPFSQGKASLRYEMLTNIARRFKIPVVYVNLVGGNDSLVFDGGSFVIDREGRTVAMAEGYTEQMLVVDIDRPHEHFIARPRAENIAQVHSALVLGLRDYVRKCGFPSAVLGLSGGIDSAITAVIAAEAIGSDRVLGVLMPSDFTSDESMADAADLAANLGIETKTIPIMSIYRQYLSDLEESLEGLPGDVTEENIQARIRGNILMALSNRFGHLVLSTGNKSELATGYCTLYGDMSGGLAVISDLYKGEVYQLARFMNRQGKVIPERVLTKEPSAELRPGQKDSDFLPPYETLDPILKAYIEDHKTHSEIVADGFPPDLVTRVLNMVEGNEYKRQQAAPGLKVSWKAFGLGRRYPIAKAKMFLVSEPWPVTDDQ